MSSLETLIVAGVTAETEMQRLILLATQARAEYERRKLSAPAKEFSLLRDAADQADLRVQAAKRLFETRRRLQAIDGFNDCPAAHSGPLPQRV